MGTKEKFYFFQVLIIGVLLVFASSCKKEEEGKPSTGYVSVKVTNWNNYENNAQKKSTLKSSGDTITLDIIDTKKTKLSFKVTTDEIKAGVPDDFNWISIYESGVNMLDSDREFQFELPVGNYQGIGILQSNLFYWICKNGEDVLEIPSLNDSDKPNSADIYNIFGNDGLFTIGSDGLLISPSNNERLGTFEIFPGQKTTVTIRMNLISLDWYDNDRDGLWSEGDEIGNWQVPEGVNTMADFIVVYE